MEEDLQFKFNAAESIFPTDIKLEDVREAIKGRDDFREVDAGDHVIFVYFLGLAKGMFTVTACCKIISYLFIYFLLYITIYSKFNCGSRADKLYL